MEIGTEISQKIRSAIKAKLIELGAYVDDELPDYIMVMVANKKTQKQMTDDLSLFLNTNTEKFTFWLHSLLKKLQAINTDAPGKHKHKEKEKHKGEKRKHKSSHSEKAHKSADGEKHPKQSSTEVKGDVKKKEPEKVKGTKGQGVTKAVAVTTAGTGQVATATEEEAGTEISIIENTDEFNEEFGEIEKTDTKKSTSTGRPPAKMAKLEKKSTTKVTSKLETTSSKPHSASSSTKIKDDTKTSRKKPSSFVASVKRKYTEIEEGDEEYDPLNPAVGSVASVVRGPSRKSSVPKSLQANKSLLMKAVSDAEKSTRKGEQSSHSELTTEPSMRSDRQPVDLRGRLKTAAGQQLMSRSKRKDGSLHDMKFQVDNEKNGEPVKKARRSSDGIENMKYVVKNKPETTTSKKISPKGKTPAVPPSRVAASALQSIERQRKVNTKKVAEPSDDDDADDDEHEAATSEDDTDDVLSDEEVLDDSSEEIEIEITDRAAQTDINMKDNNYILSLKDKPTLANVAAQTELSDTSENTNYKLSKDKLEDIDSNLLNFFIENTLPFEFVENESFKQFSKSLQPKYHFPKRKKLLMEVGMLYNTVKDDLKKELNGLKSVAFTHKTWQSVDRDMFDSVSVHYITKDWRLESAVLRTAKLEKECIEESIAQNLEEARVKWGLPGPTVVSHVSDSQQKVLEMLGWANIPCFGSCIREIQSCLYDPDLIEFLNRGRSLIKDIEESDPAKEMLEKKIKLLLTKPSQTGKLTVDDQTNWSSTLDMITKLSEQTPALHAAVMDTELISQGVDLRNQLYTFAEQSTLESLIKIISPFKTACEILTKNDGPTLQKVIPIFVKLEKALEVDADDDEVIGKVKGEMRHKIHQLLQDSRDVCLLACLVHPQTKQMVFVSQKDKDHVKALLFNEVKLQFEKEHKDTTKKTESESASGKVKKGNHKRQTKSMSDLAATSDLRYVVVNKDEDNVTDSGEDMKETDAESDSDITENSKSENSEESQDSERSVTIDPQMASTSKVKTSNKSPREITKAEMSDSDSSQQKLRNFSITVENDWLNDVICVAEEKKSPSELAKIELDLYMAESASSVNPLLWWKEKHVLYPRISEVARRLLSIPASSVEMEDVLCLCSRSDVSKVSQIKPEHVDMMVFLKQNKALYEQ